MRRRTSGTGAPRKRPHGSPAGTSHRQGSRWVSSSASYTRYHRCNAPRSHRRVSALLASPEMLQKMSPGIVTAHLFDVLCDEARQYAARLEAVGQLHALRELPYTHGSALGFGAIMREVAHLMEERLAGVGK